MCVNSVYRFHGFYMYLCIVTIVYALHVYLSKNGVYDLKKKIKFKSNLFYLNEHYITRFTFFRWIKCVIGSPLTEVLKDTKTHSK